MRTGVIFPHQLFENNILTARCDVIYLVEEWLYFRQYHFHKQKIAFHRASMKFYESFLREKGIEVVYVDSSNKSADIRMLIPQLKDKGTDYIEYIDTTDYWLERRINKTAKENGLHVVKNETPLFINAYEAIADYFSGKKKMFQTDFYKHQRVSRNILMENPQKPLGGKWTFDDENRLRYPKAQTPPVVNVLEPNDFYSAAVTYTEDHFKNNYGALNPQFIFPTTFAESKQWLQDYLDTRFSDFGAYEDAIVANEHILHHSVLTPVLNTGLLSPQFVIDKALQHASNHEIPLNSVEGFIRQILGWREYMRAVYELKGRQERITNFWGFSRRIPKAFWDGTTGIEPVDITISKVLKTGYCHHIERLMVLGNFMLLCEFHPDDVYRWFMELFIDAYDWVMVPNVYGMSQFADGGLMSTKPYISGSNYLMKMSNYKKGKWQEVWDGLFWRFLHVHRSFFLQNPRLGMLIKSFDKFPVAKQKAHLDNAENFLSSLTEKGS